MNEEKISSASVRELKAFISESGLEFRDCVTKDDLKVRAREALELKRDEIKAYPCRIVGDQTKPADLVILFFHGYGATAENFAPLANVVRVPGKNVIWVFPQADSTPMSQWFPLEVHKMATVRRTFSLTLLSLSDKHTRKQTDTHHRH